MFVLLIFVFLSTEHYYSLCFVFCQYYFSMYLLITLVIALYVDDFQGLLPCQVVGLGVS